MKTIKYVLGILVTLSINLTFSQIKPLKIGDQFPEAGLHEVVGRELDSVDFKEFKGKYIILDFWATWCAPCLAGFPKMKAIQEKYADKLVVIPVTYEAKEKIEQFFKRSDIGKLGLTSIVNDNILKRYFPHRTIPHYVWIDDKGKVTAITESQYVTLKNVEKWIKGVTISFPVKQETMERLNDKEPVFRLGNVLHSDTISRLELLHDSSINYYSILTKGNIPGVYGSLVRDSTRVSYTNTSAQSLFKLAFSDFNRAYLYTTRVVFENQDSSILTSGGLRGLAYEEWLKSNGFSYELRMPKKIAHKMLEYMQQDLNRYFGAMYGIEGRLEERDSPTLVLVSTNEGTLSKSTSDTSIYNADLAGLKIVNRKLSWLTHHLTFTLQHLKCPILDETGIDFPVDIHLEGSLSNLESINVALSPYNLKLNEAIRKIRVIVISDI